MLLDVNKTTLKRSPQKARVLSAHVCVVCLMCLQMHRWVDYQFPQCIYNGGTPLLIINTHPTIFSPNYSHDISITVYHTVTTRFALEQCDQTHTIMIYTTGKKYGIFFIKAIFFIFEKCEGCFCTWNTFLRADITFGGVNFQLTAKWSRKVQKQLFRYFSQLDFG